MAGAVSLRAVFKRNAVSILFPALATFLIYSDYSHTQKCKQAAQQKQQSELE